MTQVDQLQANHQLVHNFFTALSSGNLPDHLLTPDMTVWTTTSGTADRARYQSGIRTLAKVYGGGVVYTVKSVTAEDDRVAAEVESHGVLINGVTIDNVFVYIFRIRNGQIASVAEHFDPLPIREKIAPLFHAMKEG